jgi:hypothetical protein
MTYPPLAVINQVYLETPTHPLDLDASLQPRALKLETLLVQLNHNTRRLEAACHLVYESALASAHCGRRFLPPPQPMQALDQHFALMVHRIFVHRDKDPSLPARSAQDHLRSAYRQLEAVRPLLQEPATEVATLHVLRLHLADLSNFACFAHQAARGLPPD